MRFLQQLRHLFRSTHVVQVPVLSREGIVITYAKEISSNKNRIDNAFSTYFKLIEDQSFETNIGISVRGILRALHRNYVSKKIVQGGSSITQQVVRMVFPCKYRTIRKLYEMPLAIFFTLVFGKKKILSFYINNLYLGKGVWGAGNALKLYFKDKITPENCLAIASLSTRPEFWVKNPDILFVKSSGIAERHQFQLDNNKLIQATRKIKEKASVIKMEEAYLCLSNKNFDTSGIGSKELMTSVSASMTKKLNFAVQKYLGKFDLTVVVVDYRKFEVKAAIKIEEGNYVRRYFLTEKIRVGSLLKPFLVHCYVENGLDPNEQFESKPLDIIIDGKSWKVRNYKEKYTGNISLIDAVAISDNSVCVQALFKVGLDNFKKTLVDFGIIEENFKLYYSSILGASDSGFNLQNILRGYSSLMGLRKVDGDPLTPNKMGLKILPSNSVIQSRIAMSRVVKGGTAIALKSSSFSGAKTGTDQNVMSFIGYDPNYAVFVQASERQKEILNTFGHYDDKSYSIFDLVKDVKKAIGQFIKSDEGKFEIYGKRAA